MTADQSTLARMAADEEGFVRLGEEIQAELERLEVEEDFGLPRVVVAAQRRLGHKTRFELQQLIIHAAAALAVRQGGTVTPAMVLAWASEKAPKAEWEERVKPAIKRVWRAEGVLDEELELEQVP